MSDAKPPTISAIMPVYNGRHFLERSFPPLAAMLAAGELCEIVVADDGSTDGSGEFCRAHGARVVTTGGRKGPAEARNIASRVARGDIVWFVDADVVAHDDVARLLQRSFADAGVVAVFGSYDDAPPWPAFASQYMNLRHHAVHHRSPGEAFSFWSGLGAVRREAFLAAGGYDAARYLVPSIEDIELGYRLRAHGGRIQLVPEMQGTHLKRWTLKGVVETDIQMRALPWAKLLMERPDIPLHLNVRQSERAKALLGGALLASLPLAAFGVVPIWTPLALFALAWAVNRPLFEVFRRRNGLGFALAALAFHQCHYVYASAAYVYCRLTHRPSPAAAQATRR
ncbi:MAG TPA: glycosyltransferase family 2 protein [Myxococcota bacterium]|jgi:glycosyltransferase involved in cell wall biosynthesis